MRPQPTAVTKYEGGQWIPWEQWKEYPNTSDVRRVHSIQFSDGSEWDAINGWRGGTIPSLETWPWKNLDILAHKLGLTQTTLERIMMESDVLPHGRTAPTSTSKPAPSFESPIPMASTSSAHPEAILSEALAILSNLPPSCGWSLSVVDAQSNTTYEVNRPLAAPTSDPNDLRQAAEAAALWGAARL